MPTIVFNGKSYNHLDEMPADERQAYQQMMSMFTDENGNGIPDFLEGDMVKNVLSAYSTSVNVNGETIRSLDDLPPDTRQSVEGAFQMLSKMGILPQSQSSASTFSREPSFESKPFVPQGSPVMEEDRGSGTFTWVIIGIVLCFAVTVGAFAVIYLLNR